MMGIQTQKYSEGSLVTRTFPQTKPIATKAHMSVWRRLTSDSTWEQMDVSTYQLINNSCVLNSLMNTVLYDMLEVRVADTPDELADSPSDISTLAANMADINIIADNIDAISASLNGEYIVNGLPTTGNEGDLAVNVLDGGIYEMQSGTWVLVAQSIGGTGTEETTATAVVSSVDGLPATAEAGEIVYNTIDGYYYAYIAGSWEVITSPPLDVVGIEVVPTVTGLDEPVGTVVFASDTKKLMESTGVSTWVQVVEPTTSVAEIGDGTITAIKMATGVAVIEKFDVLPTTGNFVGRTVYLTTDGKLYRYTATGFTSVVPAQDITGTITETQIATDAITTPKIAAGAITADTIGANAVTAGKIDANAVTAGTISAGVVGAVEIASNAITAVKVSAGAITADKLGANSVTATKIAANSVTSDKILANSITAGHLQAGSVDANKLAANSVTATAILAGSVTSSKIASYSITADKIDANVLQGAKINVDSNYNTDAQYGKLMNVIDRRTTDWRNAVNVEMVGAGTNLYATHSTTYNSSGNSKGGLFSSRTSGTGVTGWGASTGVHGFMAYSGAATDPTDTSGVTGDGGSLGHGVIGKCSGEYGFGVYGATGHASGYWGVYTNQKMYSVGGYYPFTGSHICFSDELPEVGDIVYTYDVYTTSVNQAYPFVNTTVLSKDKRVVGVVSLVSKEHTGTRISNLDDDLCDISTITKTITDERDGVVGDTYTYKGEKTIKPEHQAFVDKVLGMSMVDINSLGEGMINVCSENGNIDNGDYICSSNTKGKGMKQDDDLLHNYTVAKALESVDWSTETGATKMIACTYHCG